MGLEFDLEFPFQRWIGSEREAVDGGRLLGAEGVRLSQFPGAPFVSELTQKDFLIPYSLMPGFSSRPLGMVSQTV